MKTTEEFYVGYLPNAPHGIARFIKWIIVLLTIVVVSIGFILVKNQKGFSPGTFEKNQVTEISGIIFHDPVPNIKVVDGRDELGNPILISIPLIGYGKHGADGIIRDWEKEHGTVLDNKKITIHGRLIYHDGKTLMEINNEENKMVSIENVKPGEAINSKTSDLGFTTLSGEIIDPKCYFGVMKPGEGKPHRDCAIRCISGGMPPTLEVKNENGDANYVLLLGKDGNQINEAVLPFVAEPVSITGKLVQMDDWTVMYIDSQSGISKAGLSSSSTTTSIQKPVTACKEGCCKHPSNHN